MSEDTTLTGSIVGNLRNGISKSTASPINGRKEVMFVATKTNKKEVDKKIRRIFCVRWNYPF